MTEARLSGEALLAAWEEGVGAVPGERALAVLRRVVPPDERDEVASWPIGRRDARLLDVHVDTFGERMAGVTSCPHCDERLELAFAAADVCAEHGEAETKYELRRGRRRIAFRLPSTADLLAVARYESVEEARRALAERCVVRPGPSFGDDVIDMLAARIAELDPQAAVELALTCPACEHAWSATFDVADFLWREIDARARSLLAEVASLAATYGWAEREILAMSERRRRLYLELVA